MARRSFFVISLAGAALLRCGGNTSSPSSPATDGGSGAANGVIDLSGGDLVTCAAPGDGSAWCWGNNFTGAVGDGTNQSRSTPVPVQMLTSGVVRIAASASAACAVKVDGTLLCWGNVDFGTDKATWQKTPAAVAGLPGTASHVSIGDHHACVTVSDGSLWCWGQNNHGQIGDGTNGAHSTPVRVNALGNEVMQVSVGTGHTCARKHDGSVWCWGDNYYGDVGDGTTMPRSSPVQVPGLPGAASDVSASFDHTCVVMPGATLCWGDNSNGQCGNGATTRLGQLTPVAVAGLGDATRVTQSRSSTCALRPDGALLCWGAYSAGDMDAGNTLAPTPVAGLPGTVDLLGAGGSSCVRVKDGSMWCWGSTAAGLLSSDAGLPGPTTPVRVNFVRP